MKTKKSHRKNKIVSQHPFDPFLLNGSGSVELDQMSVKMYEPDMLTLEKLLCSDLESQSIISEGQNKSLEPTLMKMVPFAGVSEYILTSKVSASKNVVDRILSCSTYYDWLKSEWKVDVEINIYSEKKYDGHLRSNTIVEVDIQDDDIVYGVICYFEKNIVTPIALYEDNNFYPLSIGRRLFKPFIKHILGSEYIRTLLDP